MTCRLCLETRPLCGSHIISECFYEKIYDDKHRFLPISTEVERLKFQQKGFREDLLCRACESRLSEWESTLKRDFVDIGKEQSNFLTINRVHEEIIKVQNINYDYFKRGILSILWRLSITSHPFYSKYQLGPYEDKLRMILKEDGHIPELHYPIMISKCKLDQQFFPDIIMGFPPGKIAKSRTVYRFIIWGILVTVLVTDHAASNDIESIILRENGELFIPDIQYTMFAHPQSVIKRIFDDDVRDMFAKMTS